MNMAVKTFTQGLTAVVLFVITCAANAGAITVNSNSSITSDTWVYYYYGHHNKSTTTLTAGTSGAHDRSHYGGIRAQTTFDLQQSAANTLDYSLDMNHTVPYGGFARTYGSVYFSVDTDTTFDLTGFYNANGNANNILNTFIRDENTLDMVFHQNTGPGALTGLSGTLAAGDYRFYILAQTNSVGPYSWGGPSFGPVAGGADYGNGSINLSLVAAVPEPELMILLSLGLVGIAVGRRTRRSSLI